MEHEAGPLEWSTAGQQTIEQAYAAVDHYFDFLKKNLASVPTGGTEWGEKWKPWADRNIGATQGYFKRLSQAKDLEQILRVHMEFVQSQATTFANK